MKKKKKTTTFSSNPYECACVRMSDFSFVSVTDVVGFCFFFFRTLFFSLSLSHSLVIFHLVYVAVHIAAGIGDVDDEMLWNRK